MLEGDLNQDRTKCRVVSMEGSYQSKKRVLSPRVVCNSPSSISDVDLSRKLIDNMMPASDKAAHTDAKSGDKFESQDARSR